MTLQRRRVSHIHYPSHLRSLDRLYLAEHAWQPIYAMVLQQTASGSQCVVVACTIALHGIAGLRLYDVTS